MAHNIEMIDGVAQMAYAGQVPWHGLGNAVSNDLSTHEMMVAAGCDWRVREVESFIEMDGERISTGQKSLVRETDNKILTNVGKGWNPVQNEQAFDFFNEYVEAGDMEMHTAGSLDDGRIVWALAKINDSFEALKGDQVDSYLLFSNPHKYGKSIDIRFTPIRVVCNNTLTAAITSNSKNQVKLNHRTKFDAEQVKVTLGLASEKMSQYKEIAEFLSLKRYTDESLIRFYDAVFPHTYRKNAVVETADDLTDNAKAAMAALNTQPGHQYGEGTWWSAFNSVTFLTDHVMGRNNDTRMNSAWFGQNQARKVRAINKAVEFAQAA